MKKLVSICTPCYNHQNFLEDYFKSILALRYENIELVLIDDCSTDNSVSIVEKWMPVLKEKFSRVYFSVNEQNLGVVKTCNKLIDNSKGEYIKIIASDDMIHPDFISRYLSVFNENLDIKICVGNFYYVTEQQRYSEIVNATNLKSGFSKKLNLENNRISLDDYFGKIWISAPTAMLKKECFDIYGMFDEKLKFEDYEFWLRVLKKEKIYFIDEQLIFYRVSETSMSNVSKLKNKQQREEKVANIFYNNEQSVLKHLNRDVEIEYNYIQKFYAIHLMNACIDGCKMISKKIRQNIDSEYFKKDSTLKKIWRLHRLGLLKAVLKLKKLRDEK